MDRFFFFNSFPFSSNTSNTGTLEVDYYGTYKINTLLLLLLLKVAKFI